MKMQHEIVAAVDGRVTRIAAKAGAQVAAGDLILELASGSEASPAA
jgi:geranyl-CoA carboxylase alpha subunit